MCTVQLQIVDVGFFACFSVVCIQERLCTRSLGFIGSAGATGRATKGWSYAENGKATKIPKFRGAKRGVTTKVASLSQGWS